MSINRDMPVSDRGYNCYPTNRNHGLTLVRSGRDEYYKEQAKILAGLSIDKRREPNSPKKKAEKKIIADDLPRAYDSVTPQSPPPLKRVYICSPYSGSTATNIRNARRYARFAFEQGYHPYAPHLYYPQFLKDDDADERNIGMHYALMNMWQMEALWVFGKKVSRGMQMEIELAEDLGVPIRYFSSELEERCQ